MTNVFTLNLQFQTLDGLFNNLFNDLDDQSEFLKTYENLKQQFILLPQSKKVNFTGFCILANEIAECLMISDFFKKMKISFILNWQRSSFQPNKDDFLFEDNRARIVPKFSSTKKRVSISPSLDSQSYPFTIQNHLSSLMNEYTLAYNVMVKNKKELNIKIQQANTLLSQRTEIIKLILQYKIRMNTKKEVDQSERRNLRTISDLMYLIDTMNRDLKKNSKLPKVENAHA